MFHASISLSLSFFSVMLGWFVNAPVMEAAIKCSSNLIEEKDVEVKPELLPDAVIDENIDVHLIRKYFTIDAWDLLISVVEEKRKNPVFICKTCLHDLAESLSIACDHCLSWSHISCVGLKQRPKSHYWYCRKCHAHPSV